MLEVGDGEALMDETAGPAVSLVFKNLLVESGKREVDGRDDGREFWFQLEWELHGLCADVERDDGAATLEKIRGVRPLDER